MVKVTDKGAEMMPQGNGPSSMESDGSFVILERSTTQDNSSQFPNGSQLQSLRSMPPTSLPSLFNQQRERDNAPSSILTGSMPSLNPEEIQRKLQEVLQENVELKETLHQNNLAMKQQFSTLVMWQEEVFKVHQSHKEKFQETKELILKLKTENTELKHYLEKCGNASDNQLKEENAKLKGQIAELQQKLSVPMPRRDQPHMAPSKKEEELTDLVKQLNTQLETAQRSRRQLGLEVESLTARRIKAEREIAELKARLQEYDQKYTELQKTNAELVQKIQLCEHDRSTLVVLEKQDDSMAPKFAAISVDLERARSQVVELKTQLEDEKGIKSHLLIQLQQQEAVLQDLQKKLQIQSSQIQSSQKQVQPSAATKDTEGVKNLFHSCEEQLKALNGILCKQTERYANLDKWLQTTASNVRQWHPTLRTSDEQDLMSLRMQIEQLMKLLAQEQAYSEDMKGHLKENENNFEKLFADYQALLLEWETYHQDQNDKARHNADYHNVQAKGFTEKLDHLMAQVLCKDEELEKNEKELKQLKDKIKKLELENEAIPILKAQVEVYQSDFNAEREARQNLAGEKERLSEDLRHLQRRNQQLLDDLDTYQRAQFDVMQNRSNDSGSSWGTIAAPGRTTNQHSRNILNVVHPRTASTSPEPRQKPSPEPEPSPPSISGCRPTDYYCPKCHKKFRILQLLQNHVEVCLELIP